MKVRHSSDYRARRAKLYPDIGDQLGAITDALATLRSNGVTLPPSTQTLLDEIAAIKSTLPKPK